MRRRQNSAFSPPFFFRFSPLVICFFCWALIGFISVGKVFGKAFRILGLDERKGRWVVEQDFYGNFRVNVGWFLAFFPCLLDQIMLILVWFKRSLHSACVSWQTCPRTSKLITSKAVEGSWILTGGYGQFREEWVKELFEPAFKPFLKRIQVFLRISSQKVYHLREIKTFKALAWINI